MQRKYQSTYIVYLYNGGGSHAMKEFAILSWSTRTAIDLSKMGIFLISEHFRENQSFTNRALWIMFTFIY